MPGGNWYEASGQMSGKFDWLQPKKKLVTFTPKVDEYRLQLDMLRRQALELKRRETTLIAAAEEQAAIQSIEETMRKHVQQEVEVP